MNIIRAKVMTEATTEAFSQMSVKFFLISKLVSKNSLLFMQEQTEKQPLWDHNFTRIHGLLC